MTVNVVVRNNTEVKVDGVKLRFSFVPYVKFLREPKGSSQDPSTTPPLPSARIMEIGSIVVKRRSCRVRESGAEGERRQASDDHNAVDSAGASGAGFLP
jgi:hypothetical protein